MIMSHPRKLILFDIDGTLISAGGAGTRSMNLAFHALFGVQDAFRDIPMAGKTDPQIMKEGLERYGLSSLDGNVDRMTKLYLQFLHNEINNPFRQLKPGIKEALTLLHSMDVSLGLLTGNLQKGAEIKLTPFGIYEFFLDGAFGSDDEDRDNLLPIALEKFKKRGLGFSPRECIVIGDTPRDVQCAKIHGAHCIAVATGPYSREDLLKTDADMVIDSMAGTGTYMDFLSAP